MSLYLPTMAHPCMSSQAAKELGLESILWVARTQQGRKVQLWGLHARGARLPPDWWAARAHWPIESLIAAVAQAEPISDPEVQGRLARRLRRCK